MGRREGSPGSLTEPPPRILKSWVRLRHRTAKRKAYTVHHSVRKTVYRIWMLFSWLHITLVSVCHIGRLLIAVVQMGAKQRRHVVGLLKRKRNGEVKCRILKQLGMPVQHDVRLVQFSTHNNEQVKLLSRCSSAVTHLPHKMETARIQWRNCHPTFKLLGTNSPVINIVFSLPNFIYSKWGGKAAYHVTRG